MKIREYNSPQAVLKQTEAMGKADKVVWTGISVSFCIYTKGQTDGIHIFYFKERQIKQGHE